MDENVCEEIFRQSFDGSSFVALCLETNILTADNVEKFEFMNSSCLSTLGNGYENQRGDSCAIPDPYVLIKFKTPNLAYISKIQVQRDVPEFSSGNVRQIEALFIDANDSIIVNEITGEPVAWRSPEDDPTIRGYFPDIRGVILKVLRTDNGASVRRLRVRITGCYALGKS